MDPRHTLRRVASHADHPPMAEARTGPARRRDVPWHLAIPVVIAAALLCAGAPTASAQTLGGSGITYTPSFPGNGAVSIPTAWLNGSAGGGLLTITNSPVNLTSSLTVQSITGSNYYNYMSGTNYYGATFWGTGLQAQPANAAAMIGPSMNLSNSASLIANTSETWSTNWNAALSGLSFGANAYGDGSTDGNNTGGAGGAVTITHNSGALNVGPPAVGNVTGSYPVWAPYASALTAVSWGGAGLQLAAATSSGNGGNGGAVAVSTASGSAIWILGSQLSPGFGAVALNGITALSEGGSNGYYCNSNSCSKYNFSTAGWGGAVSVTHAGSIASDGAYGSYVSGEIGISATSLGATLACPGGNCSIPSTSGPEQPGGSGNVAVTVTGTGSIVLTQGSAIGVMAVSAVGATPLSNYNGTEQAGNVNVSVNQGATITTGNASATYAAGVLAVSTGSSAALAPFSSGQVASGGNASPGQVTVSNAGTIATSGELSVGIGAISVGGFGIATQAASGSVSYLGSTGGSSNATSQAVSVTNSGSIATDGSSAFGIVAFSGGAGGLMAADGSAAFNGATPTAGVVLGNSSDNTNAANGGSVSVANSGSIATGDANGGGNMAIGIVAQSIGGGGGSSGGKGAAAFVGDGGGAGGAGGGVDVSMTGGSITTQNDGAIGILAQSVGGGGGNGGNAAGLFVAVGGRGGSGGAGGGVTVDVSGGKLNSAGDFAAGLLAQSVGGGGGNGGYAKAAGLFFSTAIGGAGGSGGVGGTVDVSQQGAIATTGEQSAGVVAQSVGGGGGSGGAALSHSVGVFFSAAIALGGNGGSGGGGGEVDVTNSGTISATGPDSIGMLVQSIGGGGGNAGSALAKSLAIADDPEIPTLSFSTAVGGTGGSGGAGGAVTAQNTAGSVATQGNGSIGILAQSIGGGGGTGGDSTAGSNSVQGKSPTLNLSVSVGGSGSTASSGGEVIVMNAPYATALPSTDSPSPVVPIANTNAYNASARVATTGNNAPGIEAQSIGGGGGNGGAGNATAASPNLGGTPGTAVGLAYSMGGNGGGGGDGGTVLVSNLAYQGSRYNGTAVVSTTGSGSTGILAQSIGGGGGSGGGGAATAGGNEINLQVSVGGKGDVGGAGGTVTVTNTGTISTGAVIANGYTNSSKQNVSVTTGGDSYGILAQSIGGGGGAGGSTDPAAGVTATATIENYLNNPGTSYVGTISVGGAAGAGSGGGAVAANNGGSITTLGARAYGILAQSVGGGGGIAGGVAMAANTVLGNIDQPGKTYGATVAVGGAGGSGGDGGAVTVTNNTQEPPSSVAQTNGFIGTAGYGAIAVVAQSIGGGGGVGGEGSVNNVTNLSLGVSYTGSGGVAGSGGAVTVSNGSGTQIVTVGDDAYGVLAQSIGGGGGLGSAGCTNSAAAGASGLSASQCLGNTNASASGSVVPWTDSSSFAVHLGGKSGASGSGGAVSVTENGSIVTTGARSFGIAAQSIGGGGGIMTAAAANLSTTAVQTEPGQNDAAGGSIAVNLGAAGSITTKGAGAWGIVAQSIGAGGGLVGDPSLALSTLVSNTLPTLTSSGADGGSVSITSGGNIMTTGANAHGIVAQSIGGGGGMAAGYNQSASMNVVMGNSGQIYAGLPAPTYSGQGGAITINQTGGSIYTSGAGSIAIIAQSSGNSSYMSPISITIGASVEGGSGTGAAGIMVSGGEATNNGHGYTPNTITVNAGGAVSTQNGTNGNAIIANSGVTNVINNGAIVGSVDLGSTPGDFTNNGTWNSGSGATVASSTLTNNGVINVRGNGVIGTTSISGGFAQSAGGRVAIDVDSRAVQSSDRLTIVGNAQVGGIIVPNAVALLPGALPFLSATGALSFTATVQSSLLFNWVATKNGNVLALVPTANLASAGLGLSPSQTSLAQYLGRAWNNADPFFAVAFGGLSREQSATAYAGALNASNGGAALAQNAALAGSGMMLLGSALSCPVFVEAGTTLGEERCAWGQFSGGQVNQYAGGGDPGYKVDGTAVRVGGQTDVAPGWFVGGSLGAGTNRASADNSSSTGNLYDASIALKRVDGNWLFAGSAAIATGSFQHTRVLDLLSTASGTVAASETFQGSSNATLAGGRLRAAYDFAAPKTYLRPYADLDVIYTHAPGFQESGRSGALSYSGSNRTNVVFSPMAEFGARGDLDSGVVLRGYAALGVSWQSNPGWVMDASFVGASSANGSFQSYSNTPDVLGRLKVGAQVYQRGGLEFRAEYALDAGSGYRGQVGSARLAYRF